MAMKFFAHTQDGERVHVPDAKRFSHYVNNVRFWFAVHLPLHCSPGLVVSHWESGKRFCTVSTSEMIAAAGTMKHQDLARRAIDRFVKDRNAVAIARVLTDEETKAKAPMA